MSALQPDGRQSTTARLIATGTRRYLKARGISSLCEFILGNGRRADIIGLDQNGLLHIVEIKSSVSDFRSDSKWPIYREYCDHFYFAAPSTLDPEIFPLEVGLLIADQYGAELMRAPTEEKLNASRRKTILLSFARSAADQLHRMQDLNSEVE